jgi:hypothetical protein
MCLHGMDRENLKEAGIVGSTKLGAWNFHWLLITPNSLQTP